ncbi:MULTISPECIES: hypothetical protein [Thermodesulfobacterium]|jgi:hypothetical protein|uniref:Uncharacterized protein n=2 Tax=Thermodesulfobacterium commune TaxID=1741 RepID=A0A075WZA1_9BACT|nr:MULTISPECIES: hypothetical protein [Thermodesulfobacterium]KUJ97370.1 MAG: Uncharacterized protein XD42_0972 [Thermodesulfobacterium sp. 37_54]KUK19068.1 MAG: Uncharacterized protein XD55_0877 [Thermodesulfobacterium commune]AIH04002.1 hypothetical protein HL41_04020 [Thermodesulfobacterium commune DSM 2178]KUK38250.1 MAG: Uncharacterized protein XD67_0460 [Thermodesulfobacterium commune]MBZ4681378.1 hypothetical protein [Thermodesulfobacterium sp.]
MSISKLKERLIEIELAIKNQDLDKALTIYEEIDQNFEKYVKNIKQEELKSVLNLVEFLEKLLKEKQAELIESKKFLNLKKAYTRF